MTELIARLIAAGTPPELVAEVAMLAARVEHGADMDAAADRRRERDREYRRQRRAGASMADADVCRPTSADIDDITPAPSPFLPPDPQPTPTHTPAKRNNAGVRVREGRELDPDWVPIDLTPGTVAAEIVERHGAAWERRSFERFRNHWLSSDNPNRFKRNWQAAWQNWIIIEEERHGKTIQTDLFVAGRSRSMPFGGGDRTLSALESWVNHTPH